MRIYLAARYSRLAELVGYRTELERMGHVITSGWLDVPGRPFDTLTLERKRLEAVRDLGDLACSDAIIVFSEEHGTASGGGKHVEFGAAYMMGHRTTVIGPVENVFYALHSIDRYDSWDQFVKEAEWLKQPSRS